MNKMKTVFFIPIRSGSKGLKNKNILEVNKKPLVMYTIEECRKITDDENIIISTDSQEYIEKLKEYGVNTVLRDKELASDTATTRDVVVDFLKKEIKEEDCIFVLCQATSPLRNAKDIQKGLEKYDENKYHSCISITKSDKSKDLLTEIKEEKLVDLEGIDKNYRRQEKKEYYYPNGAFFITTKKKYLKEESFFTNETIGSELSKDNSIDIDTKEDLEYFKYILNKKEF